MSSVFYKKNQALSIFEKSITFFSMIYTTKDCEVLKNNTASIHGFLQWFRTDGDDERVGIFFGDYEAEDENQSQPVVDFDDEEQAEEYLHSHHDDLIKIYLEKYNK